MFKNMCLWWYQVVLNVILRVRFSFGQHQEHGVLSIMPKIPEISVGNQMERVRFGFFRREY